MADEQSSLTYWENNLSVPDRQYNDRHGLARDVEIF